MYPNVVFEQDMDFDMQATVVLLNLGDKHADSFYGPNPGLQKVDVNDEDALVDFFTHRYTEKETELAKAVTNFQSAWDKVAADYFQLTAKIFHDRPFPDSKYEACISISDCNAYFIELKKFQVFYLTDSSNHTVAHELMHFMFFDYAEAKFPEMFGKLNSRSGSYWDLSELFNNVLLSFPEYREILKHNGDGPYPEHKQYYQSMVNLWNESRDVDKFIPAGFKLLEARSD